MVFRKILAFFLLLIFALLVVPTVFIRGISKTFLNPSFYDGQTIEESYDHIVDYMSLQISKDEDISEYFSKKDIDDLIANYIPLSTVETIMQDFVLQFEGVLNKRKTDSIKVSLQPIKDNIDNIAGDIAKVIIKDIPTCAEGELPEPGNEIPKCMPDEVDEKEVILMATQQISRELNEIIPGEFIIDMEKVGQENTELKEVIDIFGYIQMILPLILLIILLLMMITVYKPYTLIMKYLGGALTLGGVFTMISAQLLLQVPALTINQDNLKEFLLEEVNQLRDLYSFLFSFLVERMTICSVYFIGLGVLIFFAGIYISHFHSHKYV